MGKFLRERGKELALPCPLSFDEVSTDIPGMAKTRHVPAKVAVPDGRKLAPPTLERLKEHGWERNFYPNRDRALVASNYMEPWRSLQISSAQRGEVVLGGKSAAPHTTIRGSPLDTAWRSASSSTAPVPSTLVALIPKASANLTKSGTKRSAPGAGLPGVVRP